MGSDALNTKVVANLKKQLGSDVYTMDNVCISGTHSHSGPAGFLQYAMFQFTSLGHVKETEDAWVSGITKAIITAHNNKKPGDITLLQDKLYESNINRSPTSYLLNPQSERDSYPDGNTDKNMMLLHFQQTEGNKDIGVLNWFSGSRNIHE
eukprot:UN28084